MLLRTRDRKVYESSALVSKLRSTTLSKARKIEMKRKKIEAAKSFLVNIGNIN